MSPDILKGKRVFAFCGIANAESFRQTVQVFCRDLAGFRAYRDHHRYTKGDIDEIVGKGKERRAEFFVTTEKDMVKVRDFTVPARFLMLEVDLTIDAEFYDRLFSELPRKR
jgi:tetraacyldisaccharide 4'-kinase